MQLNFVLPGHYKSKNSSTDKIDMIRVLGEDPNRPDNFVTNEGKSLSEYDILNNYEYLATQPTKKENNKLPDNLFKDLDNLMEQPNVVEDFDNNKIYVSDNLNNQTVYIEQKPIDNKKIFIEQLFKNLSSTNSTETLDINLSLNLGFSLEKLKTTIQFLGLNQNEVWHYIANNLINREIIEKGLLDSFSSKSEDIKKEAQALVVVDFIQENSDKTIDTKILPNLDIQINDIDTKINKFNSILNSIV